MAQPARREPAYHRPTTLTEALALRAASPVVVLAGGTDIYPAIASRTAWGAASPAFDVLDITAVGALRGITQTATGLRLGATTTWADILETPLPAALDGLKAAARDVGGAQIQRTGTLAGNICTASPAGDGLPCLAALDAVVELARLEAGTIRTRHIAFADFITGYRETVVAQGELVTAVEVPLPEATTAAGFVKLGARHSLVISIASVAAVLEADAGRITRARIGVGACSAVPARLTRLEARLAGSPLAALPPVESADVEALTPIDDIRASAPYRRHAARVLATDLLARLARDLSAPA